MNYCTQLNKKLNCRGQSLLEVQLAATYLNSCDSHLKYTPEKKTKRSMNAANQFTSNHELSSK
jgi:hypothetical protein